MPERSALAQVASLAAFPTGPLTCPTTLLLALLGFLCGALPLWFDLRVPKLFARPFDFGQSLCTLAHG